MVSRTMKAQGTLGAIRAVIFDMDGLMVDSEPLHTEATSLFFQRLGLTFNLDHRPDLVGRKTVESLAILKQKYNLDMALEDIFREREGIFLELVRQKLQMRPGLEILLRRLKDAGYPLALASSGYRAYVNLVLEKFHLWDFFQTLVTGDEAQEGKPSPEIFLLAAKRLGVPPTLCLVLEDSEHGVVAAKRAGMQCIAVPNSVTQGRDFSLADVVVCSLEEVTVPLIQRLAPGTVPPA